MNELLRSFTALPNLHPAVLHFPLVLLPLGVAFDLLRFVGLKEKRLDQVATIFYGLGLLATAMTYWAGHEAAEEVGLVSPEIESALALHSDWALYTFWAVGILVTARVLIAWKDRDASSGGLRVAVILALVLALGALLQTADLGGALVYRHGVAVSAVGTAYVPEAVAVAAVEAAAPEQMPSSPAEDRLERTAGGGFVWRPIAGDAEALGDLFEVSPPTAISAVVDDEGSSSSSPEGILINLSESATILFPETFGDVQVTLTLDPMDFDGEIAILHHVQTNGDRGSASLSSQGFAQLAHRVNGDSKSLHRKDGIEVPKGVFSLSVSAAGRHLKGFLNGEMVTHGHLMASGPGRCGLLFDGRGKMRILSLEITPLTAEH